MWADARHLVSDTRCHYHPKAEAPLSCRHCERPLCVDCARNTQVGIRCPDCHGGRDPAIDKLAAPVLAGLAADDARRKFWITIAVGVVGVIVIPALLLVALTIAAVVAWRSTSPLRRRIMWGLGYFVLVYCIGIPLLVFSTDDSQTPPAIVFSATPAMSLFVLGLLAVVVPALWLPSRAFSRELIADGRGFAAGAVWIAGVAGAGISLAIGVAIALAAFNVV